MSLFPKIKMLKKLNENKLIAVLYANLRGKGQKQNNWIEIAEISKSLTEFYGSYKTLANKLGISEELIRETLKLLDLPNELKKLVSDGKIKHEVAWRIASINDKKNQIKIANSIIGLNTHDARDLVRIFKNNPKLNIEDYLERLKKSKNNIQSINLIILPIKELDYKTIKKEAIKNNLTVEKFILDVIIQDWFKRGKK